MANPRKNSEKYLMKIAGKLTKRHGKQSQGTPPIIIFWIQTAF